MPGLYEFEVKNVVSFNSIQTISALPFFDLMNSSSSTFRQFAPEKEVFLPSSSLVYDVKTTANTWIQITLSYSGLL
jgi:hypothetical protein